MNHEHGQFIFKSSRNLHQTLVVKLVYLVGCLLLSDIDHVSYNMEYGISLIHGEAETPFQGR